MTRIVQVLPLSLAAAVLLAGCAAPRHRSAARGQRLERLRLGAALQLADENLREGELDRAAGLLASFEYLAEPAVLLRLARIDIEQGHYAKALTRLDAIPPAARTPQASNLRGVALEALARPAEAAAAYAAAFRGEPTVQRLIAWSDALVLAGQARQALAILQTHRRQFGGDPALHAAAARVHTAISQPEQAAAELRAAVLMDPKSPQLRRSLAEALEHAGDWLEAADLWADLAAQGPPGQRPALQTRQARALLAAGKLTAAAQLLAAVVARDPSNLQALALAAAVRLRLHEPQAALELCEQALRLDPASRLIEELRQTALSQARQPHPRQPLPGLPPQPAEPRE